MMEEEVKMRGDKKMGIQLECGFIEELNTITKEFGRRTEITYRNQEISRMLVAILAGYTDICRNVKGTNGKECSLCRQMNKTVEVFCSPIGRVTEKKRDAMLRPYVCLCVCGVVMLWNGNIYLINCVCMSCCCPPGGTGAHGG